MYLTPSKTHELMVILSPDKFDRNTEKPFLALFEKPPVYVYPPHLTFPKIENPLPHKDSVLLFEGGTDVNPALYKQHLGKRTAMPDSVRDRHEERYFRLAQEANAGCVGICRGAQLLCVLSKGELIQDAKGHGQTHKLQLPDKFRRVILAATSSHHQIMNPYVLPAKDWTSFGIAPDGVGYAYRDEYDNKIKVWKRWKNWEDQEIVWFKKTRSLSIQGHPEYFTDMNAQYVQYCRFLLHSLLLEKETSSNDLPTP